MRAMTKRILSLALTLAMVLSLCLTVQAKGSVTVTLDGRVEIVSVDEKESKAGNPMLVIGIRPNGSSITINHYIVQGNEWTNRNLTEFFDSFNIDDGDFTLPTWIGAVGAARLKEDDKGYLKVQYFISKDRAEKLHPWDGKLPERQELTRLSDLEDESELPWN